MRSAASVSVTSATSDSARPPACWPAAAHSSAASSRGSSERATSSTSAPSAQSILAVVRPMPRLAPVTTHARPLSPRSIPSGLAQLELVVDLHVPRLEHLVNRALRDNPEDALVLVRVELRRDPDLHVEARRVVGACLRELDRDLDISELPSLAIRVHLDRDGGAG